MSHRPISQGPRPTSPGLGTGTFKTKTPPIKVNLHSIGNIEISPEIAADEGKLRSHLKDVVHVPSGKLEGLTKEIHAKVTEGIKPGVTLDLSNFTPPKTTSKTEFKSISEQSSPQLESGSTGLMGKLSTEQKSERVSGERKPPKLGFKPKKETEGPTFRTPNVSENTPSIVANLNEGQIRIPQDKLGKFGPLKSFLKSECGLDDTRAGELTGQINGVWGKTLKEGGTWGEVGQKTRGVEEKVTLTMPWGREMTFDKSVAMDSQKLGAFLMDPLQLLLMPKGVSPTEVAAKVSKAVLSGGSLNISEVKSTDNFLDTNKLKPHSGAFLNPEPLERQSVVTSNIRGGSKSSQVYQSHNLPTPVYGGGWSKDLGSIVPSVTPGSIQVQAVEMEVSQECKNGGMKPYVVEWPNKQGLTLLVDVSHDAKEFKSTNGEHINLEFLVGGKPLKLLPGTPPNILRIESKGRAQIALQIPKSELEKQFEGLVDGHDISVQPFYCDNQRKDFHINDPHLVTMPSMFGRVSEGKRYEWPKDKVPVNTKTDIVGVSSPFVDPTAKLQTSMETEAEFTFKVDSPQQGEKLISDSVQKFEKLALPKKTVLSPEAQEDYNKRLQKELGLPQSFFDGKSSWRIERKNDDYYYLDSKGELSPEAKKIKETNPGLVEQFKNDVAPLRPELQELGMGRPGIVRDTYLHVEKDGVVRQRGNFREDGTMSTKGGHRRDGEDSPFMVRYCRQVPCTKEAPIQDGVVKKNDELKKLVYDDNIGFQDALFHYPKDGDLTKVNVNAPPLKPEMQIESERYRYVLVHTALDDEKKPIGQDVMIELSFDISKGQKLDDKGKPIGEQKTTYGFEFGLDHLGSSNDSPTESSGSKKTENTGPKPQISEGKKEVQPLPREGIVESKTVSTHVPLVNQEEGKVKVEERVIPRDRHDRLDLTRDDLFNRPAYNVFTKCVKAFTPTVSGDNEIRIAGEKALTMKTEMEQGTQPSGYKKSQEIFKS